MAEEKEEKKNMEQPAGEEQQRLNQKEEMSQDKEAFAAHGINEPVTWQEGEKSPLPGESGEPEECSEDAADGGESPEAAPEELKHRIAALEEENSELMNRLLRLQADFDNYRKRVRAEKEELTQYANYNLIQKLLPVIDNMERACSAPDTNPKGILEGLELILKNLLEILRKEGVTPIDCMGQPFDPNCHEAVATEASNDYPANTVLDEFQKGYMMNGRVLRASMVKVSVE
ncbi:MAG: nucleotide exchange factor GrpE [Firmicutes bacterium]|nr:nucleotide exchange factor GrpE [Bacillota bacterium]